MLALLSFIIIITSAAAQSTSPAPIIRKPWCTWKCNDYTVVVRVFGDGVPNELFCDANCTYRCEPVTGGTSGVTGVSGEAAKCVAQCPDNNDIKETEDTEHVGSKFCEIVTKT